MKEKCYEFLKYCEYFKDKQYLTIKSYRSDLLNFIDFLNEREVDENVIEEYILLKRGLKESTMNRKLSALSSFFNWLVNNNIIKKNFINNIKRFKVIKKINNVLNDEDFQKMLQVNYENDFLNLRNKAILSLLFFTGIRSFELLNILNKNIDFEKKEIKLMIKGGYEKIVFFNDKCRDILKKYIEFKKNIFDSKYCFLNNKGDNLSDRYLRYLIKDISKKSGIIKNVSPHTFRHSFATLALNRGVDLRSLQELLRLKSLSTVQIYAQSSVEALRNVYDNFTKHLDLKI